MPGWQVATYLSLYLASLGVSLTVAIVACRRRAVPGATAFAVYALAEASMTLGFVLELLSPSLRGKIFWDDFQFIGSLVVPLAVLAFTSRYTRRELPLPKLTWWTLGVLVTGFMILVYTNPLHGLIRPESRLVPRQPFAALEYDYTLAFWAYVLFIYGIIAYGVGILFHEAIQARRLRRAQAVIILVGFLFPILSGIISVLEIEIGPYRDVTPLGFALGNLVIAWGLFRYRLFELIPVARKTVLENMTDAVIVLDAGRRIVDLNAAAEEIIGRSAAEVLGQPTEAVLDRWPNLLAEFHDIEENHAEIAYTLEGQERYADLTISPLYDDRGQFVGRVLVARDITERKRAEEALRESEARYRLLAENTSDYILRLDQAGNVIFATDTSQRFHGYAPDELIGTSGFDRIHPDDRDETMAIFRNALDAGEDTRHEYRLQRKDGGYMWVETAGRMIDSAATGSPEVVLVARDATARKEAEQALQRAHDELERRIEERTAELRASEARYRLLAENVDDVLWTRDANMERYTYVSPSIERLLGYTPEEMMTRPVSDFIAPDSYGRIRNPRERRLPTEMGGAGDDLPRTWEVEWVRKDGSTVWVENRARVLRDEAGQYEGVVGVTRDISERKRYAQELEQRNRALALLNEVSRAFSATLDQDRVFDAVLEETRALLDVDAMAIWLPDPETGELICRRVAGLRRDAMHGWRLPSGKGLAGWVAQHGENLIVPDLREDERFFQDLTEQSGLATRSVLSVPLRFKDGLIGVLQAVDTAHGYFNTDHLGLVPALEQHTERFIDQSRIEIQFAAMGLEEERLPPEMETALYRVVQEALTNVLRHAQASHVDVLLERRGNRIVVIVEDDGIGFDFETVATEGRHGLVGMRERAHMLGGTWTVESKPAQGTTIVVEVPYGHSNSGS